jgi:hypothetical protein
MTQISFRNISLIQFIHVPHTHKYARQPMYTTHTFCYNVIITTRCNTVNAGIQYSTYYTHKYYVLIDHNLHFCRLTHFRKARLPFLVTILLLVKLTVFKLSFLSVYRWWISQRPSSCFFSPWRIKPRVKVTQNSTCCSLTKHSPHSCYFRLFYAACKAYIYACII